MLNEEIFEETMLKLEKFYGLTGHVTDDEFLQDIYYHALKHLSDKAFRAGTAKCIRDNPKQYGFFPSAKQLLEYSEGEYIPPGETGALRKLNISVLPDTEMRMTSKQKEEIRHRGALQAKILVYGGRFMTHDEKSAFIDSLKLKPTHELEAIALQAERAQANTRIRR